MNKSTILTNYLINIRGNILNNTSYNEDLNYSIRIDELYKIEENKSINIYGYNILISKINDNNIELLINNYPLILFPNDDKYLTSYSNSKSKNEEFEINSMSLSIALIYNEEIINEYNDYKDIIDKNINELYFLFDYENNYFLYQNKLKTILYKLTNEKYLNKIKDNKEELNELNKLSQYKELIEETINYIDIYENENISFIKMLANKKNITNIEYKIILPYLELLAFDNSSNDRINIDIIIPILSNIKYKFKLGDNDYLYLYYITLKILLKTSKYIYYKYIADALERDIKTSGLHYINKIEILNTCASFNIILKRYDNAMNCYKISKEIAHDYNDLKSEAYALYNYYKLNNSYPDNLKIKVDINEIINKYNDYSNIIIAGINYRGLKIDPIEFTDGFASVYNLALMEIERKFGNKYLHPYEKWLMIKNYLKSYKIDWKSPKDMNPKVMFD